MLMDVANGLKILNYHFLKANGAKSARKPDLWEMPNVEQQGYVSEESAAFEAKFLAELAEQDNDTEE